MTDHSFEQTATENKPDDALAYRDLTTTTLQLQSGPIVVDIWDACLPSDEPPILLIHGWGGAGGYWRQTAISLSATNKVIVPDLPGTGRSQPVKSTQNLFDQVNNVIDMLDQLGVEQVQVVGHSLGGAMAILLADRQPDRFERLVLTSTAFFINESQVQIYRTIMQGFKATFGFRNKLLASVPGVPQLMAQRYFYRIPKDEKMLREGLLDYLKLHAGTAAACADDVPDPSIPDAAKRLRVPVLLVVCHQDQITPVENVDYTADMISGCEVRWIDQCGHLPMVEQPEIYTELLRDFLRV